MAGIETGRLSRRGALARRFLATLVLAALLWWGLAGTEGLRSPFALLAVAGAALVTLWLPLGRPFRLRLTALPGFVAYLLRISVQGGVDVARRTLSPSMPLKPGFVTFTTSLPHGPPLTFFMAVISLPPGTVSVRLQGRLLTVHVLDTRLPVRESLAMLEAHVSRLFVVGARPGGGT